MVLPESSSRTKRVVRSLILTMNCKNKSSWNYSLHTDELQYICVFVLGFEYLSLPLNSICRLNSSLRLILCFNLTLTNKFYSFWPLLLQSARQSVLKKDIKRHVAQMHPPECEWMLNCLNTKCSMNVCVIVSMRLVVKTAMSTQNKKDWECIIYIYSKYKLYL